MLNLLLALCCWVLLSSTAAWCLQRAARRFSALSNWPALAPLLLLVSVLPFLPWPHSAVHLPKHWSEQLDHGISPFLALPAHPGWVEQQPLQALLPQLATLLLALGSLISLWLMARQWRLWRALYQLSAPLPLQALQPVVQDDPALQRLLAQYPALQLQQLPNTGSPFVSGIRRLELWLPEWFWQLTPAQQKLLLWHELKHLQRRDPLWLLCWRLLCALFWFNPALRLLERHFQQAMETQVDGWVLAQKPKQRALYARTLLQAIRAQHQATPAGRWLQASAGSGCGAVLQHRLGQIMQPGRVLSRWQRRLIITAICALCLPAWAIKTELTGLAPAQWLAPLVQGKVGSWYGEVHSFRQNKPHNGVDVIAARGTSVQAVAAGRVLLAGTGSLHANLGNVVLLDHGGGYQSMFAHLDRVDVQPGQQVDAGQEIGTLGNSGRTTGPHLHLELLLNGQRIDPATVLPLDQLQGATGE